MDLEAPVDAWYVWFGVVLASAAIAGVAVALPTQPPPDAAEAANTIDSVAGSTHIAGASFEHTATEVRIDTARISMRNDGGTSHAAVAFGSVTPVAAVADPTIRDAFEAILHGRHPRAVLEAQAFDSLEESDLRRAAERARKERLEAGPVWRPASGTLHVRQVQLDGRRVVLVDV